MDMLWSPDEIKENVSNYGKKLYPFRVGKTRKKRVKISLIRASKSA